MPVAVMDVRIVRVNVRDRLMHMWVGVRFTAIPREIVRVLVVIIVAMTMLMGERIVCMLVRVALVDVQPDAHRHQGTGQPEGEVWMVGEQQQR